MGAIDKIKDLLQEGKREKYSQQQTQSGTITREERKSTIHIEYAEKNGQITKLKVNKKLNENVSEIVSTYTCGVIWDSKMDDKEKKMEYNDFKIDIDIKEILENNKYVECLITNVLSQERATDRLKNHNTNYLGGVVKKENGEYIRLMDERSKDFVIRKIEDKGLIYLSVQNKNQKKLCFYDTIEVVVNSKSCIVIDGIVTYDCKVTWKNGQEKSELDPEIITDEKGAVDLKIDIDKNSLMYDNQYVKFLVNEVLDKNRVESRIKDSLNVKSKIKTGNYVGGIQLRNEFGYEKVSNTEMEKFAQIKLLNRMKQEQIEKEELLIKEEEQIVDMNRPEAKEQSSQEYTGTQHLKKNIELYPMSRQKEQDFRIDRSKTTQIELIKAQLKAKKEELEDKYR